MKGGAAHPLPDPDVDDNADIGSILFELGKVGKSKQVGVQKTADQGKGSIIAEHTARLEVINTNHDHWSHTTKSLVATALTVFSMKSHEVGVHEHVQILYCLCNSTAIRAHNSRAETYFDGAFLKYKGVVSETLLHEVRQAVFAVEGIAVALWDANSQASTETTMFTDICTIMASLGAQSDEDLVAKLHEKAASKPAQPDGAPDFVPMHRFQQLAKTLRKIGNSLQKELFTKNVYEFYAAWCSTDKKAASGFCTPDACVIFKDDGPMQFVNKSPHNNVYVYVNRPLLDPVLDISKN